MKSILMGLGAVAIIMVAALFIMRRLRQAGRDAVRAENAEGGLDRAEDRRRIDENVARLSDAALDERLRQHYRD